MLIRRLPASNWQRQGKCWGLEVWSWSEFIGQNTESGGRVDFTATVLKNWIYGLLHTDYGMGGNFIPALMPGESVQVKMAWITNERDLGNMYLNLCPTGGEMEFTEDMIRIGIVDIRQ